MKRINAIIYLSAVLCGHFVNAGNKNPDPDSLNQVNWIHLDPARDSVAGISLNKAYQLLSGKPSATVLVAVIDSGVDIAHEDLDENIWMNEDEIPANGIDDDKNGYMDDLNGWNFIGGPEENVFFDTYELTREYIRLSQKYGDKSEGKGKDFEYWQKIKAEYYEISGKAMAGYEGYNNMVNNLPRYFSLLQTYLDTTVLTLEKVKAIESEDSVIQEAVGLVGKILSYYGETSSVDVIVSGMSKGVEYYEYQVKYGYNQDFDPRDIVKDDYLNPNERYYGNNQCYEYSGMQGSHGTHVAGIIAAERNNMKGTIGIAENVRIIPIRTVPSGDERDKDVANAIYYAVDNGARIINMSFGKGYSPNRDVVEKAIKYAEKKGVLMVHAAGNDAKDIDAEDNYPTPKFIKGNKKASNWLDVGATSRNMNEKLVAGFSNYGKKSVDLFAPGVKVYSTIPGQEYEASNGTSMAAPVVSGVAALLMSYFPDLTAKQVREILVKSTWKYEGEVFMPGTKDLTTLSELSVSGGIVNAYEAVRLAMNMQKMENR